MRRAFAIGGAVLLASAGMAGAAAAKCATSDFRGVWVFGSTTGAVCLVEGDRSGKIVNGRCYSSDLRRDIGTASGKVSISKACKLDATVRQHHKGKTYTFRLAGALDRSGKHIGGTGSGEGLRFTFDLTKQW